MVHSQNNSPLPVVPAGPTHRPRTTGHGQRSTGFSLIELLVAIGIIIILVGIAVVGVSSIVESAHQRQTRTMLEAAASLLNEFNVEMKGKTAIPEWYWGSPPALALSPPNYNVDSAQVSLLSLDFQTAPYRYTAPYPGTPAGPSDPASPMPVPDNTGEGTWQMQNTLLLMRSISRLPATAKVLAQLPDKSTGSGAFSGPVPTGTSNKVTRLQDAWGHPLLFVPATGLGLPKSVSGKAGHVLTNVDKGNTPNDVNTWTATVLDTIKSPDGKPFWASAGPDGDFRTGDDNLYSFGEQ